MAPAQTPSGRHDGAALWNSATDWWKDAGVDRLFNDQPTSWLHDMQAEVRAEPTPPHVDDAPGSKAIQSVHIIAAAAASPFPDRASWPKGLEEFIPWWLSEPSFDAGGTNPRIAPRGPVNAELMVIVPGPEAEDQEFLLSGAHGGFLDAMLDAMGIAPGKVYRASALPRHTPLADWNLLAEQGLGDIVRHHVDLVAPQRLMVLGQNILPLLGHDMAQSPAHLRFLAHGNTHIPVLAGWDIGSLLGRAKARSGIWQRWLEWTSADRQG